MATEMVLHDLHAETRYYFAVNALIDSAARPDRRARRAGHRREGRTGLPKTVNSTTPKGFARGGHPVTVRRT